MNEIIINGRSISIKNLTIDFTNKEINIIEDDISSDSYKFFRKVMWEQKIDKLVYLKDEKEKIYTFYRCYLGKHSIDDCIKISIRFNAYITNYYIENIRTYLIDKMEIHLEYKQYDMVNIEDSLDKNVSFTIGKMHYKIELIFCERYYKVVLQNDSKLTTEKFIHHFLLFYEFLILNLGYFLEITEIKAYNLDNSFEYGYPFSGKYIGSNNYNYWNCVLCKINKNNIKQIYKNWLKIRKESHNIYDIYINIFSVKYFIEIALSTLTNCMEGYYKSIHKSTMKKKFQTKRGTKIKDKEFKDIMKEYLNSKEGKIIFSSKDRKSMKIYIKLTNHRNYFAHLNEKKNRFYGDSNLYMLLKIRLLFRVFILKDIKQDIEIDNLAECVKDIEEKIEWKKEL